MKYLNKEISERTYNLILRSAAVVAILLIFVSSTFATTYQTTASGDWSTITWTPSTPVIASLANGDLVNIGSSSVSANVTYSGSMSTGNKISIYVYSGSTLTINGGLTSTNNFTLTIESGASVVVTGSISASNNFTLNVNSGGSFIVQGSLSFANSSQVAINGQVDITGNLTAGNSGNFSGSGSVSVGGTVTSGNNPFPTGWFTASNNRYAIANGNWSSNTSTWSDIPGGAAVVSPTSSSAVYIQTYSGTNYAVTMDLSTETVASLTVGAGNSLTISAGNTLNVTGAVTINGTLNIQSSASGTGMLFTSSTITGTGTINIQRYCAGTQYHYISSPFNNTTQTLFSPSNQFWYYNEAANTSNGHWLDGWTAVPSGSTLTVARGYALYYYPTTWTFSGTPSQLNQGTQTYTLQHSGNVQPNASLSSMSWNLVGNPYSTTLDAKAFIGGNSSAITNGMLYFWDVGSATYVSTDYASYNLAGATTAGKGGNAPSGNIEMGQGFMVSSTSATNLTFTSSMQSNVTSPHFFKSLQPSAKIDRLSIDLSDANGNGNNLLIGMSDSATTAMTYGYDGLKRKGNANIAFYTLKQGNECAISCYPPSTTEFEVPLAYDTQVGGVMAISIGSFSNNSFSSVPYLVDKLLNTQTKCAGDVYYTFNANVGTTTDRFAIQYLPPTLSVSTQSLSFVGTEVSSTTFTVTSNTNWHIQTPKWISVNQIYNNGNQIVTVTAQANQSVYAQNDSMQVIVNGMSPITIKLFQDKGLPFFNVDSLNYHWKYAQDTAKLHIKANIPWSVKTSPNWVALDKTSGTGSDSIRLIYAENPLAAPRSSQLTLSGSSVNDVSIAILQVAAPPYLQVSDNQFTVDGLARSGAFVVSTNTQWQISNISPWVHLSLTTGSTDETITINIDQNSTGVQRSDVMTISGTGLSNQTITIQQSGVMGVKTIQADENIVKVYPNPSSGAFNLYWYDEYIGAVQLKVKDLTGRELFATQFTKNANEFTKSLDLSALANGDYLLEIQTDKVTVLNIVLKK